MLARVAHALYAVARDLERAEGLARIVEAGHALALEGHSSPARERELVWEPLVRIVGDEEAFRRSHRRADARSVSWTYIFDPDQSASVVACLQRARSRALGVRDALPTEVWEAINAAARTPQGWPPGRVSREGVYPFCRAVRRDGHQIAGVMDHSMRRDAAWEFMCLGRFLERAELTVRTVGVRFTGDPDSPAETAAPWAVPLADEARLLVDGLGIAPAAMSRLLLADPHSPRSVAFCLAQIERSLRRLVRMGVISADPSALLLASAARATLVELGPADQHPQALAALTGRLTARMESVATSLADTCFLAAHDAPEDRHAQASRQAQN